MSRPTEQELKHALERAESLREQGEDPDGLARALLYLHHQVGYLASVRSAAERYLRFGLAEAEHARLVRALEQARAAEFHDAEEDPEDLGLG